MSSAAVVIGALTVKTNSQATCNCGISHEQGSSWNPKRFNNSRSTLFQYFSFNIVLTLCDCLYYVRNSLSIKLQISNPSTQ